MNTPISGRYARYVRCSSEPEVAPVKSFAQEWAKRYVQKLDLESQEEEDWADRTGVDESELMTRERVGDSLRQSLRLCIAQGWSKTEILLAPSLKQHSIDSQYLNSWEIAAKTHQIYGQALELYIQGKSPQQLAGSMSPILGKLRQVQATSEPLTLAFVNLQFYYTGQLLLQQVSPTERSQLEGYFRVIQEYLNLPLQRVYEAAAKLEWDDAPLQAVRKLLPVSSVIATEICDRIWELYPRYRSNNGYLNNEQIRKSSLRDVEMFQVYLWACVLEQSIAAVQQELFPLCVMLYPSLGVQWELVRQMLNLLGQQLRDRLTFEEYDLFVPYLRTMWEMFSPAVFSPTTKSDKSEAIALESEDFFDSNESLGNWVVG
ncbi:hypothetical protein J0895_20070 [Phormidium pseudopriestleyi FRX01]|uniref:Uncharacterized protein n=1 Tax=Phormidium pseudopriestleyi FRX01 TaxID=1759528 RepID=A0ABS3FW40_9CYAN|nr:hypothetical protein [Phormidium pseudopriestleyi]MBO0351331.1 hypothetical protein [Phormidium pseudopriestleyi FRX01]